MATQKIPKKNIFITPDNDSGDNTTKYLALDSFERMCKTNVEADTERYANFGIPESDLVSQDNTTIEMRVRINGNYFKILANTASVRMDIGQCLFVVYNQTQSCTKNTVEIESITIRGGTWLPFCSYSYSINGMNNSSTYTLKSGVLEYSTSHKIDGIMSRRYSEADINTEIAIFTDAKWTQQWADYKPVRICTDTPCSFRFDPTKYSISQHLIFDIKKLNSVLISEGEYVNSPSISIMTQEPSNELIVRLYHSTTSPPDIRINASCDYLTVTAGVGGENGILNTPEENSKRITQFATSSQIKATTVAFRAPFFEWNFSTSDEMRTALKSITSAITTIAQRTGAGKFKYHYPHHDHESITANGHIAFCVKIAKEFGRLLK